MSSTLYKVSPSSLCQLSFGKLVVTNLQRPELPLFEFVGSAVDIWQILENGSTLPGIYEELRDSWEDFGPQQEEEVRTFIEELLSKGLIIEELR